MDADLSRRKKKSFISDVVSLEKKKLVLPVLMSLILVTGVLGGSALRDEAGDFFDSRTDINAEISAAHVEYSYFNDSLNESLRERQERVAGNARDFNAFTKKKYLPVGASLGVMYGTPLIPLTPSSPVITSIGSESLLFSRSDGYYLIKEVPISVAEIVYHSGRITDLAKEVNQSRDNWTLQKFRSEVEEIKSVSYPDEELIEYYRNLSSPQEADSPGSKYSSGLVSGNEYLLENIAGEKVREVKIYHFVPSLIATFTVYYLLSGLAIASFRRIRGNERSMEL